MKLGVYTHIEVHGCTLHVVLSMYGVWRLIDTYMDAT